MGLVETYERVSSIREVATQAAIRSGLDGTEDGARDAFRHALAGILITEELGPGFGYVAAELISLGDFAQFLAGQRTAGATFMDWTNNFAGVGLHTKPGDLRGALDNLYKDLTSPNGQTAVWGQRRPIIEMLDRQAVEGYLIGRGYRISPSGNPSKPSPTVEDGTSSPSGYGTAPNPENPKSNPPPSQEPNYPNVPQRDFEPDPPRPEPEPNPQAPDQPPDEPEPKNSPSSPEQPQAPEVEPEPVTTPLTKPIDPGHETLPPPPPDFRKFWNRDPDGLVSTPIDPGFETPLPPPPDFRKFWHRDPDGLVTTPIDPGFETSPPPPPDFRKLWNRDPDGLVTTPIDPGYETPPPPKADPSRIWTPDPRIISTSSIRMNQQIKLVGEILNAAMEHQTPEEYFLPLPKEKGPGQNIDEFAIVSMIEEGLDATEDADLEGYFLSAFLGSQLEISEEVSSGRNQKMLSYRLSDLVISIATLKSKDSRLRILDSVLDFVN